VVNSFPLADPKETNKRIHNEKRERENKGKRQKKEVDFVLCLFVGVMLRLPSSSSCLYLLARSG